MIVLRVDDVGRQPGDSPEHGTDSELRYFAEWRTAAGLEGLPVYYGVVPAWIRSMGWRYLRTALTGKEQLAVHGWDHVRGATVTHDQMAWAHKHMKAEAYIPPFNAYTEKTISDWALAGGKYFFGGLMGEPPHYDASQPWGVEGILHLPACPSLYGRAAEMLRQVQWFYTKPVVATLHVPWDEHLSAVRDFVTTVKSQLVPLSAVQQWLQSQGADQP